MSVRSILDDSSEHRGSFSAGTIYSCTEGSDDAVYWQIAPLLRQKVGRLLNDKMPTSVAVSPAMNHGGPFPATGSPQVIGSLNHALR